MFIVTTTLQLYEIVMTYPVIDVFDSVILCFWWFSQAYFPSDPAQEKSDLPIPLNITTLITVNSLSDILPTLSLDWRNRDVFSIWVPIIKTCARWLRMFVPSDTGLILRGKLLNFGCDLSESDYPSICHVHIRITSSLKTLSCGNRQMCIR